MKLILPLALLGLPTIASAQVLNEELKLTAVDAATDDRFGLAAAVDGTTALIGSRWDDDDGSKSGSAYLFDTATGQQLFKLTADSAAAGDLFGWSVAIDAGFAVVGAPEANFGTISESGLAFLFDTTNGQQLSALNASDAAAGDEFGDAVAISGNTIVVGAQGDGGASNRGSVYVFDTSGGQLHKFTGSDSVAFDFFGTSVAISGTTAIIGSEGDDHGGNEDAGSAYIFTGIGSTTTQELFKLTANDAASFDFFGTSVGISGDLAIAGAPLDDHAGNGAGSAYVFDTTTGQQLFKLTADDAAGGDFFGASVAISGTTAIIGAFGGGSGNTGTAYVFDASTGTQLYKLTASDGVSSDSLGTSVAIWGSTAIAGAGFDDDDGPESGSAYVFDVTPCPGDIADSTGFGPPDGQVDFGDFFAMSFLVGPCPGNIPGCTGDIADTTGFGPPDGQVDFGDFFALSFLVGPCP